MRKILFSTLLLGSLANAEELVGWISDASCGASNANATAASRECANNCIKNGSKAVFVSDKDQKVYQISDAAKAAKFLDKKVKVAGTVKGDTIQLASIAYTN